MNLLPADPWNFTGQRLTSALQPCEVLSQVGLRREIRLFSENAIFFWKNFRNELAGGSE